MGLPGTDYFRSASGRHFVCAQPNYGIDLQELADDRNELTSLVAKVVPGQLLELQEVRGDWGYGIPMLYRDGAQAGALPLPGGRGAAGIFRLDWVKLVLLGPGLRRVDVDVDGTMKDFSPEKPKNFYERFEAICRRKALDRVASNVDAGETKEVPSADEGASRPLAEVILEEIIKADCQDPAPPPGLGPSAGTVFSPSRSTSSGEAHDADDDEGSPKRRATLGRRPRLARDGRHGLSPEAFSSHAQSPMRIVKDETGDDSKLEETGRRQRHNTLSSLLQANRTGKLQRLLENLRREQQDMVRSAVDLQDLKERFKVAMLSAHRTGELQKVAEKLATEVERRADDFQRLKERALESLLRMKRAGELDRMAQEMRTASEAQAVEDARPALSAKQRALQSLLEMKRSGELQLLAEEMDSAQKALEAKAAQLRGLRGAASLGNGELERLVDQMTEELESQAESIRSRVRKGLLRAHRRGELQDLRQELDELADEVPSMPSKQRAKRWQETISSDSEPENVRRRDDDLSSNEGSDADTKQLDGAAAVSRWQAQANKPRKRWADMTTSSDSDLDPVGSQAGRAVGPLPVASKALGTGGRGFC
ncbi:unnamed protein product [Cladocopium goreaui]|uniref:Inositol-1,4,5-trisphosphate 5-phosphatase 1 n=1 Tax=Cladocopium goreaui TaxID=2562237 RepID=A0A9P1FWH2_9DINO|nr:unnamed protein product [Cladocopium goreaui]